MFHLGCAVWGFKGWLGGFLPEGTPQRELLRAFAERLTAVEGNTMFYAVPTLDTLQRWAADVPDGFHFCPKLPRSMTHDGSLAGAVRAAAGFQDLLLAGLGPERLGPCFAQLPPGYGPDRLGDLEAFVSRWQRDKGRLTVEVRHRGWFEPDARQALDAVLRRHRVGRVTLDTRAIYDGDDDPQRDNPRKKPCLPVRPTVTSDVALVRYIGHPEPARNDAHLDQWAAWVVRALERNLDVYFFAHCPDETWSPDIARAFYDRLVALDAPVPPLPWDSVEEPARQQSLFDE